MNIVGEFALIAIDPGKLSGYAVFRVSPEGPELVLSLELNEQDLWDQLTVDLSHLDMPTRVVFETFKITPQTGKNSDAPWSLEHIGVIKYLCREFGVQWHEQTPAAAKTFATNERLKKLKFWHVGGAGHANDAIRHAVLYLVQTVHWQSRDLLI